MEPHIQETGLDGIITEVALALIAQQPHEWYASGTAVIIAPHLAITARHVVDDYWRHFDQNWKLKVGNTNGDFGLLAFQVIPGRRGVLWAVRHMWCSEHTDLAVLQLTPYSDLAANYRWRHPMLQFLPPAIGAEVWTFGYRGGSTQAMIDDAGTEVRCHSSPSTAVGSVMEVHERRRDRGFLSFPCFRTSAPFTHGMSGGPIFHAGRLAGIICSSGLQGDDGINMAYGTTLWPLLALKLQLSFADHPPNSWYSILDLVDRGYVRAADRERITIDAQGHIIIHPQKVTDA